MTKIKWYQSKTLWFNVIMTILGVIASMEGLAVFDHYAQTFLIITLLGNTILRIWFTSSAIATPAVMV